MAQKLRSLINGCLVAVLFFVLFPAHANAFIVANETDKGFDESGRGEIKSLVMESAGYFLKSQADVLLFSNKVELSELHGLDYSELEQLINKAVYNMEQAVSLYGRLVKTADLTPYCIPVVNSLKVFSYSLFKESNQSNSDIFNRVEAILKAGDIRGVYHRLYNDTQAILGNLNAIKVSVEAGQFPSIAELWKVNKGYSDTLVFGQEIAHIFFDVTGK